MSKIIFREVAKKRRACSQCRKLWTDECTHLDDFRNRIMFRSDAACGDFEPAQRRKHVKHAKHVENDDKKGKEGEIVLALDMEKPTILKPSGFYTTMLIEPTYLVYLHTNSGITEVRPSLIIMEKDKKPQIYDFMNDLPYDVRGTFPSEDLATLITVEGVRKLINGFEPDFKVIGQAIDETIYKHVMVKHNPAYPVLIKYFIIGSFFYDIFDAYPILGIIGPSESGKSRILTLILALSYHGSGMIDPTEAGIFRTKEEEKPTLCFDEAEYLTYGIGSRNMINTLINASYSKTSGMAVTRIEEENGKRIRRRFDLYSPMAISCISGFTGVTASRMITLIAKRIDKDYPVAKISSHNQLRDSLYFLRFKHAFTVKETYDKLDISNIVSARFSELFKPLFTLIKVFGTEEEWKVMSEYATEYQELSRAEALNISDEEEVLTMLWEIEPVEGNWYSIKELRDKINLFYSRDLKSQRVSHILKRLGFTKRHRTSKGRVFSASKEQIIEAAKSLGIMLEKKEEKEEAKEKDWLERSVLT